MSGFPRVVRVFKASELTGKSFLLSHTPVLCDIRSLVDFLSNYSNFARPLSFVRYICFYLVFLLSDTVAGHPDLGWSDAVHFRFIPRISRMQTFSLLTSIFPLNVQRVVC